MRHGNGKFMLVFLVMAALALGTSTASAQNDEGFGVQVLGGLVWPSIDDVGVTGVDVSGKTGFLVGLGLGGNRGGTVGVGADILYGQRTTEFKFLGATSEAKQNVVDVPVMLKVNLGAKSASGARGFVQAGGYFDWLFSSKLNDVDISDDTDGFEVGLVFGGGVEFARVSAQARYYHGLRDIDRKFSVGSSAESKSRAFAILLGFRLN